MLGDATAASHPGGLTRPRDWIRVNRVTHGHGSPPAHR